MKSVILTLCLITIILSIPVAAQPGEYGIKDPQNHSKFDPARDAQNDLQRAMEVARKSHKRILLDVGGEWCIWCHRLDSLFIQNKDLEDFLNKHYVVVKVNVSKENENKAFLSRYLKVAGYPHLFVLNENGKLLHSQDTGELEFPTGHPVRGHDREKVLAFLKQWSSK